MTIPYSPLKPCRSSFLTIRSLRYHIREWGSPDAPLLFMLHGWMDISASFQFVVDKFRHEWHVVAPDWRGFGLTQRSADGAYMFPEYLGDLDAILEHYSPDKPAWIVGHSMGGNVTSIYAGARPERVERYINLEGMGFGRRPFVELMAERYALWMSELRNPPRFRSYDSLEGVAQRLRKQNARLTEERAAYLAPHWAGLDESTGQYVLRADPEHKIHHPYRHRPDEVVTAWSRIQADVLWVAGRDSEFLSGVETLFPDYAARIAHIPKVRRDYVEDAGHMMHHEQPERIAAMIESFMLEQVR